MGLCPYFFLAVWVCAHIKGCVAMKMTIEIPEDVLAELMQLTGHQTKRDAVEFALREAARRAKWRRVWSEGLGLTPDQLAADAAPKPADLLDAPDIDEDAVRRAVEALGRRRIRRANLAAGGHALNEAQAPYGDAPRP
jgi:Arc/MetJ family transcription regulator